MVVIPWRGNLVFLTKFLPTSLVDWTSSLLGFSSTMDDFSGRGAVGNRLPGIEAHKIK